MQCGDIFSKYVLPINLFKFILEKHLFTINKRNHSADVFNMYHYLHRAQYHYSNNELFKYQQKNPFRKIKDKIKLVG